MLPRGGQEQKRGQCIRRSIWGGDRSIIVPRVGRTQEQVARAGSRSNLEAIQGWVQDAGGAAAVGAGMLGGRGAPRGAARRRALPLARAAAAAHSSQDCTNCFSRCSPAEMRVREKWVQQQPVPGLTLRTVLSR